jgi:hypothetical protein
MPSRLRASPLPARRLDRCEQRLLARRAALAAVAGEVGDAERFPARGDAGAEFGHVDGGLAVLSLRHLRLRSHRCFPRLSAGQDRRDRRRDEARTASVASAPRSPARLRPASARWPAIAVRATGAGRDC